MTKLCTICDCDLKDGEEVVAIMVAKFVMLDSDVNFAIEHPSKCVEIVHSECFDYDEYGDEDENDD